MRVDGADVSTGPLVMILALIVAAVTLAALCAPYRPAFAADDLPARVLEAWEGRGARCVLAYNAGGQMASHGSAALSCAWGHYYHGEFRRLGSE